MGNQSGGNTSVTHALNELEDLLNSAIAGDEKAFTLIWQNLNPRLSKYIASQSYGANVDSEGITSETWISVAKDISKFKGDFNQFKGWIYKIARNRIVDAIRKQNRQVKSGGEISDFDFEDTRSKVDSVIELDESVKEIVTAINRLPKAQAEVIMLRIVADLEVVEVSKILDKSENTIRVLSHRGLETLRSQLRREDLER